MGRFDRCQNCFSEYFSNKCRGLLPAFPWTDFLCHWVLMSCLDLAVRTGSFTLSSRGVAKGLFSWAHPSQPPLGGRTSTVEEKVHAGPGFQIRVSGQGLQSPESFQQSLDGPSSLPQGTLLSEAPLEGRAPGNPITLTPSFFYS